MADHVQRLFRKSGETIVVTTTKPRPDIIQYGFDLFFLQNGRYVEAEVDTGVLKQ